jgi:tetratricopeptide (TPR) repeat protein
MYHFDILKGRIHYSEGQIDEALKWFQQAYSINPQNADNLQQIAKCL